MSVVPARLTAALADRYRIERELGVGERPAACDLEDRKALVKPWASTRSALQHPHILPIYALGIMGYEMLAGWPPSVGRSAQEVLPARVTQLPLSITARRAARCSMPHPKGSAIER